MVLNSAIRAGEDTAPDNFPRYEKEKIAGGITVCVVRGEAIATASYVVALLPRWLFAFEPPLVLLLCFSQVLFAFRKLILSLHLLLLPLLLLLFVLLHPALFVFPQSPRLGISAAELRLAVRAWEDDAWLVLLGWGGLLRPAWLCGSRDRGRDGARGGKRDEDYYLGWAQSRLWRVSFPGEISIIWGGRQCDKMTPDMKVGLNMAH